jgi:hypothetical protein
VIRTEQAATCTVLQLPSTNSPLHSPSTAFPPPSAHSGELSDHTHSLPRPEDLTHFSNAGEEITQEPPDFGDKERTKRRYEEAANRLRKSLCLSQGTWEPFNLPEFNDISNNALLQVEEAVESMLNVREKSMKTPDFWSKKKLTVKRIFKMVSPFAKNILQVAKEGSSVLFPSSYHSIAHLD